MKPPVALATIARRYADLPPHSGPMLVEHLAAAPVAAVQSAAANPEAGILVARLAVSGGRAVIQRLERTDDALREAGAYWDASWTRFPATDRARGTAQ